LPCGCERADVAQEARLGLARAVRAWQPARGPFRAFAALCARNQALRALDAAGARKHQFLSRARSLDDHQPRAKARVSLVETPVPANDALQPGDSVFCVPLGEQLASTSADADPLRTVIGREQLGGVLATLPALTALERLVLAGTLNDKSQRQLAAKHDLPRKAVMLALRSVREKLAAQPALAA
jgi:RNA polymerase sigma factor (sigma-70 family)